MKMWSVFIRGFGVRGFGVPVRASPGLGGVGGKL